MRNDLAHIRNGAESPWIRVLFILAILALAFAAGNARAADVPFSARKTIDGSFDGAHSVVAATQGSYSVVVWGAHKEDFGQRDLPAPNTDFVKVSAATWGHHSVGLKSDGSIVVWGESTFGVCNVPLPNSGFVEVAGGDHTGLGLKTDGSIVAWGDNTYGQCSVPAPNTGFVAVAGGLHHCLGLKSDGSIAAWGDNGDGQCNVPLPIPASRPWPQAATVLPLSPTARWWCGAATTTVNATSPRLIRVSWPLTPMAIIASA